MKRKKIKFKIRNKLYDPDEAIKNYDKIIINAIEATKKAVIKWIGIFVPKRTGQLQKDLAEWIKVKWVKKGNTVRLDLVTDIKYALKITGDVAHKGTWYEHSGRLATAFYGDYSGFVFLDDPLAKYNWWELIPFYTLNEFKRNLMIYTNMELGV